ncbi:MAG: glycine dehydrogenase (aminomethyl-transferring), partial [Rhodothermales bacterium]
MTNYNSFSRRHIGPSESEAESMAREAGFDSVQDLIDRTIPEPIRLAHSPNLPKAITEHHLLQRAAEIGARNRPFRSFIGQGYADTITPPPILRNIMENPNWYTQYTPYQAEIAQGRLEALLNYQTMVIDLTGMEIANASLLDEGTAAAEAMMMARRLTKGDRNTFFVSERCHPQTIAVVKTRAVPLNVDVVVGDHESFAFTPDVYGALVQYPTTDGEVLDYSGFCKTAHDNDALVVVA